MSFLIKKIQFSNATNVFNTLRCNAQSSYIDKRIQKCVSNSLSNQYITPLQLRTKILQCLHELSPEQASIVYTDMLFVLEEVKGKK